MILSIPWLTLILYTGLRQFSSLLGTLCWQLLQCHAGQQVQHQQPQSISWSRYRDFLYSQQELLSLIWWQLFLDQSHAISWLHTWPRKFCLLSSLIRPQQSTFLLERFPLVILGYVMMWVHHCRLTFWVNVSRVWRKQLEVNAPADVFVVAKWEAVGGRASVIGLLWGRGNILRADWLSVSTHVCGLSLFRLGF